MLITGLPGVEVVRWFHRYAMVAPSVHPEGRPYAWAGDVGDPADVPEVGDLPDLPWQWIEALQRTSSGEGVTALTPDEVADFFEAHTDSHRPGALKGVQRMLGEKAGSRHDKLVKAACWAMTEVAAGWYAAEDAEKVLADWWKSAFNGADSRKPDEGEFGRAIVHGVGWAVAQAEDVAAKVAELGLEAAEVTGDGDIKLISDRKAPAARDVLVNLALDEYTIGRTEDERTYLVPHEGANVALFSGAAKTDLARRHMKKHGKSVGRSPLDEAWTTIEGYTLDAEKSALPLRVATDDTGRIVLDLGDVAGRAVVVTPDGWEVVDRSPVTFRRSKAMLALPLPVAGGHPDELFTLLNVAAVNRDLFVAWLTSTLFDSLPHPAPVLRGEQGAAKSSTARACTSAAP